MSHFLSLALIVLAPCPPMWFGVGSYCSGLHLRWDLCEVGQCVHVSDTHVLVISTSTSSTFTVVVKYLTLLVLRVLLQYTSVLEVCCVLLVLANCSGIFH